MTDSRNQSYRLAFVRASVAIGINVHALLASYLSFSLPPSHYPSTSSRFHHRYQT